MADNQEGALKIIRRQEQALIRCRKALRTIAELDFADIYNDLAACRQTIELARSALIKPEEHKGG